MSESIEPLAIFHADAAGTVNLHRDWVLTERDGGERINTVIRITFDWKAGVKYPSIYIEESRHAANLILKAIKEPEIFVEAADGVSIAYQTGPQTGPREPRKLPMANRLIAYTPTSISPPDQAHLEREAHERGTLLTIHDKGFFEHRAALCDKPIAFISHDSRDKGEFVRDLAARLVLSGCPVWYDEFSLNPGDSLRESIENGLKQCERCILVISPNFITNEGWGKVEFNSVFTREIVEKMNVVIPIWHGVSRDQVYEYCPSLANKVALNSNSGIEAVVRKLKAVLRPAS